MISKIITLLMTLGRFGKQFFKNPPSALHRLLRYFKIWVFQIRSALSPNSYFVLYLPKYRIRMRIQSKDSIALPVFLGEFEKDVYLFVNRFLKPGMVFFDIGAYWGLYTLIAGKIVGSSGQVHSFEPSSREFHKLLTNVKMNCLTNVFENNTAVSNSCCNSVPFFLCPDEMGAFSSLRAPSHPAVQKYDINTITVRTITVDEYIRQYEIRKVDLIKIDTEGAELQVLQGASNLLSLDDAPIVICELSDLTTNAYHTSGNEILSWFQEHEFFIFKFNIREKKLVRFQLKEKYVYENIIAVKKNQLDKIK